MGCAAVVGVRVNAGVDCVGHTAAVRSVGAFRVVVARGAGGDGGVVV